MYLKKHFKKNSDESLFYEKGDNDGLFPVVIGVEVKRLPKNGMQKISTKLFKQGQGAGWIVVVKDGKPSNIEIPAKGDYICIKDPVGDIAVKFKVLAVPGRVCLHCGEKLSIEPTGEGARKHVADMHAGLESPDVNESSGYVCPNYYDCKVVEV